MFDWVQDVRHMSFLRCRGEKFFAPTWRYGMFFRFIQIEIRDICPIPKDRDTNHQIEKNKYLHLLKK